MGMTMGALAPAQTQAGLLLLARSPRLSPTQEADQRSMSVSLLEGCLIHLFQEQ